MTFRRQVLAALLAGFVLAPLAARAHDPSRDMVVMANRFLDALDDGQREQAHFDWKSDKRTFWHFVPDRFIEPGGERPGLPIKDMNVQQRLFAHGLLSTALTSDGYQQSVSIMALEKVLYDIEKRDIRQSDLYYVSIFGKPSTEETWSWRFEGHHLSVNVTLVKGKLFSITPSFFGANPHEVKQGPLKGTKVLAAEEELARELVRSLDDEQRESAVIAEEAPEDILTGQDAKADRTTFQPVQGVSHADLNEEQQALLKKLIAAYTEKYRPRILEQIAEREPWTPGKDTYFAWAGPLEEGGHYYRVQTPTYLFEYDNTQNDANHVHAVWRHFDGDFGEDLLKKHYETAHAK